MKIINLTKGFTAKVDDKDFDYLNQWRWKINTRGYAVRNKRMHDSYYKTILMHKEVLGYGNKHVDHINGDKLDNRKSNLRFCTVSENMMNQKVKNTNKLGIKGVYKVKNHDKYVAQIQKNGEKIYLGSFETPDLAMKAYQDASVTYFGRFRYGGVV